MGKPTCVQCHKKFLLIRFLIQKRSLPISLPPRLVTEASIYTFDWTMKSPEIAESGRCYESMEIAELRIDSAARIKCLKGSIKSGKILPQPH